MENNEQSLTLCLFEDERYPNFFPLSLYHPIFDLRIGAQTLRGRLVDELNPGSLIVMCRPYLAPVLTEELNSPGGEYEVHVNEMVEGEVVFLNGRLITVGTELAQLVTGLVENSVLHKKGVVVAAKLSGDQASSFMNYLSHPLSDDHMLKVIHEIKESVPDSKRKKKEPAESGGEAKGESLERWAAESGVSVEETGLKLLSYYWQLIGENSAVIVDDFQKNPLRGTAPEAELFKGVNLIKEEDIVIGSEVEVRSGTVLDASEGPIIIADRVSIEPNAIIYGPCFIGEHSIIRGGAKIGHGTSLGKECRIGGEVEETIVTAYSNKQHEGFLGHSYVGSWVNIGAGSCNSDLKNNYGQVRAWSAGRMKETGRTFLGVVIGDHSKIAINTKFNTGTVVGFNANITSSGFPPKFVPSFTWLLEPDYVEHDLEKAMKTAEVMMDRRNIRFTSAQGELFKALYRFVRQSGHTI